MRLAQTDLWEDYDGPVGDTLDLEIYDHWLEKAEDGMSTDDRGTHDHDHDHEHPGTTPDVNETGHYELMAEAMGTPDEKGCRADDVGAIWNFSTAAIQWMVAE